jgi:hypothetical protein
VVIEPVNTTLFIDGRDGFSLSQEFPCIYGIGKFNQKIISLPGEPRKDIDAGPNFTPKYLTSNGRIGMYEGNGGTGITYYSPVNSEVGGFNLSYDDAHEWADNSTSYIQGAPLRNFDNAGIYEDDWYVHFGTEGEANAALASMPGVDQSYSFDFTKENMVWWNANARLLREGSDWTWYLDAHTDNGVTSYSGKFMAPYRAWNASGFTSISFDIACTSVTSLNLNWQKPGLDSGTEYQKIFSVQPDGQFHTVTVPISTADANFSGIISSIGLTAGNVTGAGAKVIIRNIHKN